MTEPHCNVGILFADISGSMKLYEAFGNRGALAAIERCCAIITGIVAEHGGAVVKTIGDEVMAAFPDPAPIWSAAVAMQTRIEALEPLQANGAPLKLGLRVGFNYGQAIPNGDDFFGETVNVAARMVQIAKRGQIITTGGNAGTLSAGALPSGRRFSTRDLDWLPIKGKPDGLKVVEVLWREDKADHATLIDLQSFSGLKRLGNDLHLKLGGRDWRCDGACTTVSIGREPTNMVVLSDTVASRHHATIERRLDRWVLIDHSSNGTFLSSAGREMHLRHEETILDRSGVIGFGAPVAALSDLGMSFAIERRGA